MLAQVISLKQWTRDEFVALERAGLIDSGKYELIEGQLIERMNKNQTHNGALALLCVWLRSAFGDLFVAQGWSIDVAPVDNPTSEPQPDVIVLVPSIDRLADQAKPEDISLIVEVSDSLIYFDLSIKANLYARARVAEYWVADINASRLIVHRDPSEGRYQRVSTHSASESVTPLAAPDKTLRVGDIFRPTS